MADLRYGGPLPSEYGILSNNVNINNDDVMMTKLTISDKCSFYSQVVNS